MSKKRITSILLIAVLIFSTIPLEQLQAASPINTNPPMTQAQFETYLIDHGFKLKNSLLEPASLQTFNFYGLVVYGNPWGTPTKYSSVTNKDEYRYLGYDAAGNNYTNTYYPNDDRGTKTPLEWSYEKVSGAADSWATVKDPDHKNFMLDTYLGFLAQDGKSVQQFTGLNVKNKIGIDKARLQNPASFKNGYSVFTQHKGDNGKLYYATLYGPAMDPNATLKAEITSPAEGAVYYMRAGEDSVKIPVTAKATASTTSPYVKSRHIKNINISFMGTENPQSGVMTTSVPKTGEQLYVEYKRSELEVGENPKTLTATATMQSTFQDGYTARATRNIKIIVDSEPSPYATATIDAEDSKQFTGTDVPVTVKMTGTLNNLADSSKLCKVTFHMRKLPAGADDQYQRIDMPAALVSNGSYTFTVPAFKLSGVDNYSQEFEGRVQYVLKDGTSIWGPPLSNPAAKDSTYIYKQKDLKLPVPIITAPDTAEVGSSIYISGSKSYDPDGTIEEYYWEMPGVKEPLGENKVGGTITYLYEGRQQIILGVTDNDNQYVETAKIIQVTPPYPVPIMTQTGALKVNRKVTLDASPSYSPPTYPIDHSKTTWTIAPCSEGITAADIKYTGSLTGITKDFLVKKAGKYKVTLTVTNSANMSSTTEQILSIVPDKAPIANFTVVKEQLRDPDNYNKAQIVLYDKSCSEDGDIISKRTWKYAYDSDNDGLFTDETWKVLDGGNNPQPELYVSDVGKYAFELEAEESFGQPTIPEFILLSDILKANTSEIPSADKITEVINLAPIVDISADTQKKLDMVVVTDYEGQKFTDLDMKLKKLKYDEQAQKYDLQYQYVTDSYVKEQNFDTKNEIHYSSSNTNIVSGALNGTSNATTTPNMSMTITVPNTVSAARFSIDTDYSSDGQNGTTGAKLFIGGVPIPKGHFETLMKPGTYQLTAIATQYTGIVGYTGSRHHGDDEDGYSPVYGTKNGYFILDNIKVEATKNQYIETMMTEKVFGTDIGSDNIDYVTCVSESNANAWLKKDGTVWANGYSLSGQVYPQFSIWGYPDFSTVKQLVGAPANIKKLEAKNSAIFALTEDGKLYYTGNPYYENNQRLVEWIGTYYAGGQPFTGWRLFLTGVKDIQSISAGAGSSYAVLMNNGDVYYHNDLMGTMSIGYGTAYYSLSGIVNVPFESRAMIGISMATYIATVGLQKIPGLAGIDVMGYNNGTLVAHDRDTKKTYAIGNNPGGLLGFASAAQSWREGSNVYSIGEVVKEPIELTALRGKEIKSISITVGGVLTTDGKIYRFSGALVRNAPLARFLSRTSPHFVTESGQVVLLNELPSYFYGYYGTTYIAGLKEVYGTYINKLKDLTYREGAEKIFLYISDNKGQDFYQPFGNHFPALDIDLITKTYLTNNKFDSYLVTPTAALDLKNYKFLSQELTLRQLVSGGLYQAYDTGQIDRALGDILKKYVNHINPERVALLVNEESIDYLKYYYDFENDIRNAERYKYDHDPAYFENSMGLASYSGQWLSEPKRTFDKVGKYTLTYQAQDNPKNNPLFNNYWLWSSGTNQLEIYVHRRPTADFSVKAGELQTVPPATITTDFDTINNLNYTGNINYITYGGGVNNSKCLRGVSQTYYNGSTYVLMEQNVTFTINVPGGAVNPKLTYYIKSQPYNSSLYTAVRANVNGAAAPIGNSIGYTKYELPLSPGTNTFTVEAYKMEYQTIRHRGDEDAETTGYAYGEFYLDNVSVSYTDTYKNLTFTSKAYDIDRQSQPNKGIVQTEWKWKYESETTWRDGLPSTITKGKPIYVWQRVVDEEGAWSHPAIKLIDIDTLRNLPEAQFTIAKNPITAEELLKLKDTSYVTEEGSNLVRWHWIVQKLNDSSIVQNAQFATHNAGTGELAGYDSNVKTSYETLGPGSYKIYLRVKDSNNSWSDGGTDIVYDLNSFYSQTLIVNEGYKLMNFRVSIIRDLQLESYYRSPTTGRYPDKPIYASNMAIDGANFGISSLTKGYKFEFEIDSINFNGAADTIEIMPRFYTADLFTRDAAERDLYWEDSNHKVWKVGQGGHAAWNKIILTAEDRKASGGNAATWRGEYLIPGSSWAVPKGTIAEEAKAADLRRDIIVNFQIKGYKAGVEKFNYNLKQWPIERMNAKSPYQIGDVIKYSHSSNNLNDIKFKDNR